MADVPHLAWPFRMGGRKLAQVEQDSIEDVQQNVYAYLATTKGERPLAPDFGLEDPTFAQVNNTLLSRIAADIEEAEDGRAVVTIESTPDAYGRSLDVRVTVDLAE